MLYWRKAGKNQSYFRETSEGAFILIRKSKEENNWLIIKYQ